MLDQARRSDPALEPHFDRNQTREPIFVKNIENVQGDERDVIIFSVAVGPDKTGRDHGADLLPQQRRRPSPAQRRRHPRAAASYLVFATLRPEQIDLGRTSAKGVVDFKHFLEFAEARRARHRGSLLADRPRDGIAVRRRRDAGAAGQRMGSPPPGRRLLLPVDLGVVHPDFPGRYLAGVECDGATYHRSATARDRDRLREMVADRPRLAHPAHLVTEWWMDAASAAEKIHVRLTADLEADKASRMPAPATTETTEPRAPEAGDAAAITEPTEDPSKPPTAQSGGELPQYPVRPEAAPPAPANDRESVEETKVYARGPAPANAGPSATSYRKADPSAVVAPDRDRFYDVGYRGDLRNMIDYVVGIEAPIYLDVLIDRIARAHGFQRSGETVQKVIKAALGRYRFPTSRDGDREIIWLQNALAARKTTYRGAGDREHVDIPLPELAGLAEVLRSQGLDDEEGVIRGMQEHFGLGRLAVSTRQRFEAAVAIATA